jgi:hypothetical protein
MSPKTTLMTHQKKWLQAVIGALPMIQQAVGIDFGKFKA